jgi:hypothetical protein
MAVPLLNAEKHWVCPNCNKTDVTFEAQPHSRFHACPGLRGITAPMIPAGINASVTANVREDYVGQEQVTYDGDGRPIMSVITTRDDGQDCAVFAPVAIAIAGQV